AGARLRWPGSRKLIPQDPRQRPCAAGGEVHDTLELVPRTQQVIATLLVVVVRAVRNRIDVLILELVGQIQSLRGQLEAVRNVPARSKVDVERLLRAF